MLIKICGIQKIDTLICCSNNNINFFGMIFYDKSPRNIKLEDALTLQSYAKKLNIKGVGVFVNEKIEIIKTLINKLSLEYIQIHGDEDENYIKDIKSLDVSIIKKISIKNSDDLKKIEKFPSSDYLLFDYSPKKNELPGGNARSFNWDIIKDLDIKKPWFLSGGINSSNIQYIRKKINPFGVDLSSGVEKKLGIKDNDIINNFIDQLNNA